jgi:hypothetical protein
MYDWVQRHTSQSWHERFRKNQAPFSKRIRMYIKAGLNNRLKTADEQQAGRDKLKDMAGPSQSRKGKEKEKETASSPTTKGKETEGAPKRRLVASDDEDENEAPRKKDPPRLALGRNRPGSGYPTQPTREPLFLPGPSSFDVPESAELAAPSSPTYAPASPTFEAAEPAPEVEAEATEAAPASESAAEPQLEQQQALEQVAQQPEQEDPPEQLSERAPPFAPAEPQVPAAPASPTPATQAPPSAQPAAPAAPASPAPAAPVSQPAASPAAYAPRPSAVADLIDRRRTPKRGRHSLATVAAPNAQPSLRRVIDTVSVSPGQLRTPPPPPREYTPGPPQTPLTPAQLQQKLDAGREMVASAAQTYRSYIDRWLAEYGVGQAEIMAAVEEVRGRTDLTKAPLVFGEVERVLAERYGRL